MSAAAQGATEARGFLKGFAAAAGAALAVWIAIVLAFDPFLAFGTRILPQSMILPASRMLGDEQLIKDHLFARQKPGTVIIGSSRSAYGIDPRRGALGQEASYNLAMLGASLAELEGLAAAARRAGHVKRLVIGLDHYMFFQSDPGGKAAEALATRVRRMEAGHGPIPIPLQNIQTFLMSTKLARVLEDLIGNWRRKDNLGEADKSGLMHGTYRFRIADRARTFEVTMRSLFEQGWYTPPREPLIAARLRRVAGMIRATCQRGIRVDALLSPEHAMLHEAAVITGQQQRREQLRRDIARLMEIMSAEQPDCLRYRDASGLFDAAVEPLRLPPAAPARFIEVSHYAPAVGERLMLAFSDPDQVNAAGIDTAEPGRLERDILNSRIMLDAWRATNPDDAAFVKRIQASVTSLR
jgi:hypothetical protein